MSPDPTFALETATEPAAERLVVGLSTVGMAGLSAADYLVKQRGLEQVGNLRVEGLPAITPFEEGRPRHPSRLYAAPDIDATVLVGELFVPVSAASRFTDTLLEWADGQGIEEITMLYDVAFPHGPEEHTVYHVATPGYREAHFADDGEIGGLRGGYLDGVAGELTSRGLDGEAPRVGVLITPSHPPGPDLDAAILLLEALESVYGLTVDPTDLERSSAEMKRYLADLSRRMEQLSEGEGVAGSDYPGDRMYM